MQRIRIRTRCPWTGSDPLLCAYHDEEWGVPERDGRALWEKLVLDGFQAGLSWRTVLAKRDAFRQAFCGFRPERVARFAQADVERLMAMPSIIRSRQKILATIANARAYVAMQEKQESFSSFVWNFVGGSPLVGNGIHIPTKTKLSADISRALKQRGFSFVGPTIVYAWMQAVGMVNDHAAHCFLYTKARYKN